MRVVLSSNFTRIYDNNASSDELPPSNTSSTTKASYRSPDE